MKKGFTVILLGVFLLYRIALPTTVVHAEEVEISAPSGILMEMSTGTVLFEKDADTARPPASVTKIMTILLIFDALENGTISLDDEVSTSEYAASMGGSQVFLEPGEIQTVDTLLKCISVASANDACVTMSECICGNEQEFVKQMNERAKGLGMRHTNFVNCNGLDADGHEMRDIALMSRELMTKYPQIKDYCTVWMENITHTTARGSSEFGLTNTNKLIRQYEYATGLKTGSTGKAKFCVSATASKNDVDLIAVTLLNYGFGKCQIYKAKERKLPSVLVKGGKEEHLKIQYEEGFTYVDTEGSDLSKVEEITEIPDEVKAPVKKGDTVGRICYRINGKEIGSVNLIASTPVEKADFGDYLKKIWKKLL